MLTNEELISKAAQAGYDYRAVYGVFPDKIGIEFERLRSFDRACISFPEPPPLDALVAWLAGNAAEPSIKISVARFEPVMGPDIIPDEVYLPDPGGNICIAVSGADMACKAASKKAEGKQWMK